jgi:hypothetical protein
MRQSDEEVARRRRAVGMMNHAVKKGIIKRTPCVLCGSIKRLHGHHSDYSKPLDVVWLCHKHHHMVTWGKVSLLSELPMHAQGLSRPCRITLEYHYDRDAAKKALDNMLRVQSESCAR